MKVAVVVAALGGVIAYASTGGKDLYRSRWHQWKHEFGSYGGFSAETTVDVVLNGKVVGTVRASGFTCQHCGHMALEHILRPNEIMWEHGIYHVHADVWTSQEEVTRQMQWQSECETKQ